MPSTTTPSRNRVPSSQPVTPMSERQQMKLVRQLESPPTIRTEMSPRSIKSRSRNCNSRGETPLHKAAIRGDIEAVQKCLDEGADPNAADFAGWTPLHEAANHGWVDIAALLIQAGANVNAQGWDDYTPLHDAAVNGHSLVVTLLLDRGADTRAYNKSGKTPRDIAQPFLLPLFEKTDLSDSCKLNFHNRENDRVGTDSDMRRGKVVDKGPRVTLKLQHLKKRVYNSSKSLFAVMEEKNPKDDVYEFKSSKEATPVRVNSASPDAEDTPEGKAATDGSTAMDTENPSNNKRVLDSQPEGEENDDETRKKKRKTEDGKTNTSARLSTVRNITGSSKTPATSQKATSPGGKTTLQPGTTTSADRKSPSSPKGGSTSVLATTTVAKCDDAEDSALKVPPLKIVIPQSGEPEAGTRNGKNTTARHQALPYVVSSSSNDSEKDEGGSPTDPAIGMLSAEDQKINHQRVLRSSNRNGNGEGCKCEAGGKNGSTNGGASSLVTTNTSQSAPASTAASPSAEETSPSSAVTTAPTPAEGSPNAAALPFVDSASCSKGSNPPTPVNQTSATADERLPQCDSDPPASSTPRPPSASTPQPPASSTSTSQNVSAAPATTASPTPAELHPRKRKLKHRNGSSSNTNSSSSTNTASGNSSCTVEVKGDGGGVSDGGESSGGGHGGEGSTSSAEVQPVRNCYQLYLDIKKQIERRRKGLFPVQPKPPQGFKDYLLNRGTYLLASNAASRRIPSSPQPKFLAPGLTTLFVEQEKERHRLRIQHVIEKEKLVLAVEQEILRVHGRAARALANQSLPFSVCTVLKDMEVYNLITPEQEEKDRNARSRYNGRLFLSWLQDVDDKWEKIKEAMLLRHHNEAESLHAVQKMDWEWKMIELGLCEYKTKPEIFFSHVPMVHVSDDFDLLPA